MLEPRELLLPGWQGGLMLNAGSRLIDVGAAQLALGREPHHGPMRAAAGKSFLGAICGEKLLFVGRQDRGNQMRADTMSAAHGAGASEIHARRLVPHQKRAVWPLRSFDGRTQGAGGGLGDLDHSGAVILQAGNLLLLVNGLVESVQWRHQTPLARRNSRIMYCIPHPPPNQRPSIFGRKKSGRERLFSQEIAWGCSSSACSAVVGAW